LSYFFQERALAMIALVSRPMIIHCSRKISLMVRSLRAIATLASAAVLACWIFAISWVGLALLGY
jgi:hypothetical protein